MLRLRLLEFTFQNSSIAEPCRTRGRIIPLSSLHFSIEAVYLLIEKDHLQPEQSHNHFIGTFCARHIFFVSGTPASASAEKIWNQPCGSKLAKPPSTDSLSFQHCPWNICPQNSLASHHHLYTVGYGHQRQSAWRCSQYFNTRNFAFHHWHERSCISRPGTGND